MPVESVQQQLEEELIQQGATTPEQIAHARKMAEETTEPFPQVLLNLGFVTEETLLKITGALLRVPFQLLDNV